MSFVINEHFYNVKNFPIILTIVDVEPAKTFSSQNQGIP
jgi:hypothetical protein